MMTFAPETLRPQVSYNMREWKPAMRHTRIQRAACTAGTKTESFGNCTWQTVKGLVWYLPLYVVLCIIKATYLPAILIGFFGGLLLWYLLDSPSKKIFRRPMIIVTALLVAAALFAAAEYRFIPIAALVFAWIVYGLSKLAQLALRDAPTI